MDRERERSTICVLLAVRCSGAADTPAPVAAAARGTHGAASASSCSTGVGARDEQALGDTHSDRDGSTAHCASLPHAVLGLGVAGGSAPATEGDSGQMLKLADGGKGAVGITGDALSIGQGAATDSGLVGGEFASDMPIRFQRPNGHKKPETQLIVDLSRYIASAPANLLNGEKTQRARKTENQSQWKKERRAARKRK